MLLDRAPVGNFSGLIVRGGGWSVIAVAHTVA